MPAFSACVIANSISKNWTCNLQYQKASKLKVEMLYLLSLLQGAAKEQTPAKPVSCLNSNLNILIQSEINEE